MRKLRHDQGGWVIVPAMAMITLMLALGLAMLAIVDAQTGASARDQRADSSFNGAESVMGGAVAALGSQGGWNSIDTTDPTPCGEKTYTAANTPGTTFGESLRQFVTRSLGTSAGNWKVNLCAVASTTEPWSESYLITRRAHPTLTSAAPALADMLWVRAQATVRGETRAVAARADVKSAQKLLPTQYAIATGSMGTSDFGPSVNTLVTNGLLGALLNNSNGAMIQDLAAKIGVRCGLLNLLDPNPDTKTLCLAGTLASADDFLNLLGEAGTLLTDTLGTGRFVQLPSHQTATAAEQESWKRQAQINGTYFASLPDGAACLPATTSQTSIVYIETIGDGNGTCHVTGPNSRRAAMLYVGSGRIRIDGDSQDNATFNGVVYAANKNESGGNIVSLVNRGWVEGAIFVDGPGKTWIDPPNPSVTTALCNLLPLLQQVTCKLLSGLGLLDFVVGLLGVGPVVQALLPQVSDYIAVQRNTEMIGWPKAYLPESATVGSGTFKQIPPN